MGRINAWGIILFVCFCSWDRRTEGSTNIVTRTNRKYGVIAVCLLCIQKFVRSITSSLFHQHSPNLLCFCILGRWSLSAKFGCCALSVNMFKFQSVVSFAYIHLQRVAAWNEHTRSESQRSCWLLSQSHCSFWWHKQYSSKFSLCR